MRTEKVRRTESGMARLSIIGIVLAVVVVGGGIAWFGTGGFEGDDPRHEAASGNGTSSSSTADVDAGDPDASDAEPKAPIEDHDDTPEAGKTIVCTHSEDGQPFTSYWKSSELFRFDVNTPEGEVHTIAIDRIFYSWGASLPSGIKMPAQSGQDAPGMPSISPDFIENLPDNANANCSTYTGSDSIFTLPKGVSFRSMPGQ